jgi:hypothetical protein
VKKNKIETMKIQLDTIRKTIKIEESINCNDFFNTLNSLLPNNAWKEFNLEVGIINNWAEPIIIKEPYFVSISPGPQPSPYPNYPYPNYPYPSTLPWITCDNGTGGNNTINCTSLKEGVFNIQY